MAAEDKPKVVITTNVSLESPVIEALSFGLEEEGIPFEVQTGQTSADAPALAHAAAESSRLGVGIGVDTTGWVAVQHAKLPAEKPYLLAESWQLVAEPRLARAMGQNAARLVKGQPMKQMEWFLKSKEVNQP